MFYLLYNLKGQAVYVFCKDKIHGEDKVNKCPQMKDAEYLGNGNTWNIPTNSLVM